MKKLHAPIWVIAFLPKKWQDHQLQRIWDNKSDEDILYAHEDAMGWINISKGRFRFETTIKIAERCQDKLDTYILPQIKKRGLEL